MRFCLILLAVLPVANSLLVPARRLMSAPRAIIKRQAPCLRAKDDGNKDKIAAYVADKGLEGSGPMSVVNKIAPSGFRFGLYALFGIIGAAGVAISATQGDFLDSGVNGKEHQRNCF